MRSRYVPVGILSFLLDGKKRTYRDIAYEMEVSYSTVRRIITDLAIYFPIEIFHGGRENGGVRLDKQYIFSGIPFTYEELQNLIKGLVLLEKESNESMQSLINKIMPPEK